jgi:hypothetical protein
VNLSAIERTGNIIPFIEKSDCIAWSRNITARAYIKGYKDTRIVQVVSIMHQLMLQQAMEWIK